MDWFLYDIGLRHEGVKWGVPYTIFRVKKITGKGGSLAFLNTLIRANSLNIKNAPRGFNAVIENENKNLTNILNFFLGSWSKILIYVERDRNNRKIFVSVFRYII